MTSKNITVLDVNDFGFSEYLTAIRSELERVEVEAFATGSRIRGTHNDRSDLDLIVLSSEHTSEVDVNEIDRTIEENTELPFEVDTEQYSLHEIKARLRGGDPLIVTLFYEFVPLTLSDETLDAILAAFPKSSPDQSMQFINRIKNKNKSTACVALVNDLIYDGYECLSNNGELPVPPEQLGERLRDYDVSKAERVETAVQLEEQMKAGDDEPETILEELITIYSDKN